MAAKRTKSQFSPKVNLEVTLRDPRGDKSWMVLVTTTNEANHWAYTSAIMSVTQRHRLQPFWQIAGHRSDPTRPDLHGFELWGLGRDDVERALWVLETVLPEIQLEAQKRLEQW